MSGEKFIHFVPFEGHTFSQMFSEKNSFFEEGESENPFKQLLKELEDKGFVAIGEKELSVLSSEAMLLIIYFGQIDYEIMNKYKNAISVYVASEPAAIDFAHSDARLRRMGICFDYILTWNDNLVDSKTFIKFNYLIDFSISKKTMKFEDRKLITNISANKKAYHPDELYSDRYRVIKYFSESHPGNFDLYGIGWNKDEFSSYRGTTASKRLTLAKYKFSLCFENQAKTKGYITEKIWDCLLCGTIPIYWGADNIAEYVPENCFIDFRDYLDIEDLSNTLISMQKEEWEEYITNIEDFVANSREGSFSAIYFAKVLGSIYNRGKRININFLRIIYLWWIKSLSKVEKAYRFYGVFGTYRIYRDKSKLGNQD